MKGGMHSSVGTHWRHSQTGHCEELREDRGIDFGVPFRRAKKLDNERAMVQRVAKQQYMRGPEEDWLGQKVVCVLLQI